MIYSALFAFACTFGFAIIFNIPRKVLIVSSAIGSFGWILYERMLECGSSVFVAALLASLLVGVLGEFSARIYKEPATIFIIPGIVPLVPGYGLYFTILQIIDRNYSLAGTTGFETVLTAISIAFGVILSLSLFRMIRKSES